MKAHSIEWLHAKIDKHIRLAQSYTEIESLGFIIRSCRLKPYDYVFKEKNNATVLYRWWFDEFGNSLYIHKDKRIKILCNDLALDMTKIIGTDLYAGLSLDRVAKMSKLFHLVSGKDDDLYQPCYLLTFLGLDEHLRSFLYLYGEWEPVSPLILGMKNLKVIFDNLDARYFHAAGKKKGCPMPCASPQSWISCLPAPVEFVGLLKKQHETIENILESK